MSLQPNKFTFNYKITPQDRDQYRVDYVHVVYDERFTETENMYMCELNHCFVLNVKNL